MIRSFLTLLFAVASIGSFGAGGALASDGSRPFMERPAPARDFFMRWERDVSVEQRRAMYESKGLVWKWRSRLVPGLDLVEPKARGDVRSLISSLPRHPKLRYAHPNHRILRNLAAPQRRLDPGELARLRSLAKPNDPMLSRQWALVGAAGVRPDGAWEITHGSKNVKVAVIDTGVDATHPELADRVAPGFDFIDETAEVRDHHGHGTHVSGIIGARTNNGAGIAGVSPEVTFIPIRAVPSQGDETDADLVQSFEFAVKSGARVANCSFGKGESGQAVADVIAAAGKHGLLVVVAAGNNSQDINKSPTYPASFKTPNMVVVASIGSSGKLSSFSNFGLGAVDLASPGGQILSTLPNNGYDSWSGTSMAAPQVVGVAALALAANPALDVLKLKEVLLRTVAKDAGLERYVTTSGRVDATAAVKAALSLR